jgi:hypothetical protein
VAGIDDRLRRLEDAQGVRRVESEGDARHRRIYDRLYHALENGRRSLAGLDPLPMPEELEETREEILDTLGTTIPHYRRYPGYQGGDGAEFLAAWEDALLEELTKLDKGDDA